MPSRLSQGCKVQRRQSYEGNYEKQITRRVRKRSTVLEQSVRTLLVGLNMFDGTNLNLISDVNQDT